MNDEQKQIEEMAKVIQGIMYYAPDEEDDRYRYLTHLDKKSAKEIAEALCKKGYRKQSDTVREFVERLFAKIRPMYFSLIGRNVGEIIDELAKEYGVECHYLVPLIEYMSGQGAEVEE